MLDRMSSYISFVFMIEYNWLTQIIVDIKHQKYI